MFHFLTWLRRSRKRKSATPSRRELRRSAVRGLEWLETRDTPSGTWAKLNNIFPDTHGAGSGIELLSSGDVLLQVGPTSAIPFPTPSTLWYRFTPDSAGSYQNGGWTSTGSMPTGLNGYADNVLANGHVFVLGGGTSTAELYDPSTGPSAGTWSSAATSPVADSNDTPTQLLPNGNVLAGNRSNGQTYVYQFNSTGGAWSQTGSRYNNEPSNDGDFVLLPDGSALAYDLFASYSSSSQAIQGERYVPSLGQWVPTTNGPAASFLSGDFGLGPEIGAAVRLPQDGRVFWLGALGPTAFYTPATATTADSWAAGPALSLSGVDYASWDSPAAELPSGKVLLAVDQVGANFPTSLVEFDPTNSTTPYVRETTSNTTGLGTTGGADDTGLGSALSTTSRSAAHFLDLPNGQVLLSFEGSRSLWVYTPTGSPDISWKPTVSNAIPNGDGSFTLTGTQLTGVSEGAAFGNLSQMSTNFPVVRLTATTGTPPNVYYATSYNWTPGVADGASRTVQFTLPSGMPAGTYNLQVIASGIASDAVTFHTGTGTFSTGPMYADELFAGDAPGTAITDADPVASGNQAGVVYGTGFTTGNCFSDINSAITQAAARGTYVVVNGNGTSGAGNFSGQDVNDSSGVPILMQHGDVTLGSLAGSSAAVVTLHADTLTTGDSTNTVYNGIFSLISSGSIVKQGSDTWTLGGDNTGFSGDVTITGLKIQLANPNALAGSTVHVNVNLSLDPNGLSAAALGALDGSGAINLGSTNLTVGGDGANTNYSGVISGSATTPGLLFKIGTGTMELSADNSSFHGGVTISGGVVEVGNTNAVAGSTVTVNVNGGLDVISLVSSATIGALQGSGSITVNNTALTVGGDNASTTYAGNFLVSISGPFTGPIAKSGTGTWTLSGDESVTNGYTGPVTIGTGDGVIELDSQNALYGSTVTVTPNGGLDPTGVSAATIGGLAGSGNINLGDTALTIGDAADGDSTTYSGVLSGNTDTGSLTKDGSGTLTLNATANTYTGGTTVVNGVLAVVNDADLGGTDFGVYVGTPDTTTFGLDLPELAFTGTNPTTSTGRSFVLDYGWLEVDSSKTVTLNGGYVVGQTLSFTQAEGYMDGAGTFATGSTGETFSYITSQAGNSRPAATIVSNSASDQFDNFINGGSVTVAAGVNSSSAVTTAGFVTFTNDTGASVTLGAGSRVNVDGFSSYGTLTLNPATVSAQFTLLINRGSSVLDFDQGSKTYIGTPATAGTTVAGVDLHGVNALVSGTTMLVSNPPPVYGVGALFVNNGFVADSVGGGEVIVDGNNSTQGTVHGALYKGAGTTYVNVVTQNGGIVQAGNSPGVDHFSRFTFGPGGVGEFNFVINNATGTAGPTPDSDGHVSGWSQVRTGDFVWTADSTHKVTVSLQTLANPTTVGTDVAGAMDHFDPSQRYVWEAVHWSGTYSGPTDAATLNGATTFDTSAVLNAAGGKFSWQLDTAAKTLSLVYTPPPAVAAVQLDSGSITVTFSAGVNFAGGDAAGAFRFTNTDTGATVDLTASVTTDSLGRTVVTLSFDSSALAAGHYRLSILSSAVTGDDGTALDGSGTGTGNGIDYLGPIWTV